MLAVARVGSVGYGGLCLFKCHSVHIAVEDFALIVIVTIAAENAYIAVSGCFSKLGYHCVQSLLGAGIHLSACIGIPGEDAFCNVHKVVRHIILADAVFLVDKFKVFVALGALRVHILFVFRKIRAEFYHHAKSVCAFGKYVNAVCPFDSDG